MNADIMKSKLLLVDDERDIINLLEEVLRQEGYGNIIRAANGEEAVAVCKNESPDAVILGIMLPGIDGIEVCKRIREFSYCPVLFLSSKNDDTDKILGLVIDGDDYVTKPFSPKEVAFRVKTQLRRRHYEEQKHNMWDEIRIGAVRIDVESQRSR